MQVVNRFRFLFLALTVIGLALMMFPLAVSQAWLLWSIGAALLVLLAVRWK